MNYVLRRLKSTTKHLLSLRGMLLAISGIAAVGSILTTGSWSQVLAALGAAALATLLLLMSLRLSEYHSRMNALGRQQKKLTERTHASGATAGPARSVARVGPNPDTLQEERIELARHAILSVRGDLAATKPPPSTSLQPPHAEADSVAPSPTITVVVPCYNESEFLAATLESVRRQTFTDWECIIVDDASTDRSLAEAYRYAKTDDRFRLVRHKTNAGLSAARNTGLRLASGRYVTFLDSDDLLMADSLLDRLEAIADTDGNTAGVYCGMKIVPEDIALDSLPSREQWNGGAFVDFVSTAAECPFNAHAPLLQTAVVRAAHGFDETMLAGAEDWDLWLRLLRRGYNFKPSKWTTAVYRQKTASMAKTGAVGHVAEAKRQIASSYQEDPSVLAASSAAHPFPLPLPTYQQQLITARRALQYAATAMARGDKATAQAILTGEDVTIEDWMDDHICFDDIITTGFRRAYGLGPKEVEVLADDLAPLRSQLLDLVDKSAPEPFVASSETETETHFDILFVPQNAAQASAMLEAAALVGPDLKIAFLNTEQVTGAQGSSAVVAAAPYRSFTLNDWVLGDYRHSDLVVSFPREGLVEEIIAATVQAEGRVAEIVPDGWAVLNVDDRPDYGHDLDQVSPADVARWAATARQANSQDAAATAVAIPRWQGVSEPDPDSAWMVEEYPDTFFDAADIARFKDIHRGERCVVIGNGPSLNQLDLRKLKSEYTIGVNGIFYAADQMGFDLSYYVVEDTMVMRDNVNEIRAYNAGHKFFPSIYRNQIGEAADVTYFMMNRGFYATTSPSFCLPRFSTDATQRLYSGQSVTIINLQLAYYMGFKEVVLIGMDFSYTVPEDSKVDGAHILSMGDDPNHFHPDYFGKGKIWKDPKLDRVLANYQMAKVMYEADGRRIINATPGGKLELFDRVPYDELFG